MKSTTELDFRTSPDRIGNKNLRTERLKTAIQNAGGNKAVASRAGLPLGTLNNYVAGGNMKLDAAIQLAIACNVSLEWLAFGITGGSSPAVSPLSVGENQPDTIDIPFVSTEASAGFGLIPTQTEEEIEYVQVSKEFIYKCFGLIPKTIFMIKVVGDSMIPTIKQNDRLIINTAPQSISHGIYVICINGSVYVKRIGLKDAKHFTVISDNPQYPPFDIPMSSVCWGNADPEAEMRIIGRVAINCQMLA